MAGILLDHDWFCSPECARAQLIAMSDCPDTVTLHDPQFSVDRSELPGVDAEDVNIQRSVTDKEDAATALDEAKLMHSPPFRVTA
jgi:hypothetical protein